VRGGLATAVAAAAVLVAPAGAAAKTGSIYDMTRAAGFERVTFTGDADSSCATYGVCGYSGTVTYSISGAPRGTIVLARSRSGRVSGGATYRTHGTTRATVTPPAGSGATCSDTESHPTDVFSLGSAGSSLRNLLLTYHGAGDDYLDTRCPGPNEIDAAAAGALPEGRFKASDFFRGPTPRFGLSGGSPFKSGGFNATSEWRLKFKATGRGCNPRCRIPAHRPR
jgi:hypothetical protein